MIYLDNNGYTLLDPQVKEALLYILEKPLANPSSTHKLGQEAKAHLLKATKSVASFLGVKSEELVFTSCATEALNMLIRGLGREGHVISSALEHIATLQSLDELKNTTILYPEEGQGSISVDKVVAALRPDTKLIVLMWVNNETGVKNPIPEIAQIAEERGIFLVVDGVALLGKELFEVPRGVSALSFAGSKIHALSGVGCAVIRKGVKVPSFILGGPQQKGRRGGTENLLGIISFAEAIEVMKAALPEATSRMQKLRDRLEEGILHHLPKIHIHGAKEPRVCNVSNIAFPGIDGETLLIRLDLAGLAVSLGSACASGGLEPSHVLLNMGVKPSLALASLRFSLSRFTTAEEIEQTIEIVAREVGVLS